MTSVIAIVDPAEREREREIERMRRGWVRRDRHLRDICIRHGFCVPGVMGGVVCSCINSTRKRRASLSTERIETSLEEEGGVYRKEEDTDRTDRTDFVSRFPNRFF